ncbi:MAG: S8 family serine peptidase [Gammaproteobacteria bacterium]|nr:S8 family serine peptidase [Gammaproteobacteria bacterium]
MHAIPAVTQRYTFLLFFIFLFSSFSSYAIEHHDNAYKKNPQKDRIKKQHRKNKADRLPPLKTHSTHKGHEHADREILVRFKSTAVSNAQSEDVDSESIRHLKKRGETRTSQLKKNARKKHRGRAIDRWRKIVIPDGMSMEEAIATIEADPDVESVEPNYIIRPQITPNDLQFNKLWGMQKINAPGAWNVATGVQTPIVAVIDTGVDYNHVDLAENIWTNVNEIPGNNIDDDGNGYVDDVHGISTRSGEDSSMDVFAGHGTHVAGTIGAVGNNLEGVVGVNWNTQIMPVRFLGRNGGTLTDAIEAIEYAVANGAKIANLSWGCFCYSQALKDAMAAAGEAGVLFVAAAGNSTNDNDSSKKMYPASYDLDNIISVAATDEDDNLSFFSNYGATTVDLAAPGVRVQSTGTPYFCGGLFCQGPFEPPVYFALSGTSMAAPHVSGVAALLWGIEPNLTIAELKGKLLESIDALPRLTGKVVSGGRLNAEKTLKREIEATDFSVSILPSVDQLDSGEAGIANVRIQTGSSFTDNVILSVTSSNDLINAVLDQYSVAPGPGATVMVPVTYNTDVSLPIEKFAIHVSGTDEQARTRSSMLTLDVSVGPDFNISATPISQDVAFGTSADYEITLSSINGYSGTLNLNSVSAEPAFVGSITELSAFPNGMSVSFNPSTVSLVAGGTVTTTMSVTTPSTPQDKDFNVQFSATDAYKSKTANVELGVWRPGVDLGVSPVLLEYASEEVKQLNYGLTYRLETTVTNQGSETMPRNTSVEFYLSSDKIIDGTDRRLAWADNVDVLAPGESQDIITSFKIPTDVALGSYYIGIFVNRSEIFVESDSTNNVVTSLPLPVTNVIDLRSQNIGINQTSFTVGDTMNITAQIENSGLLRTPGNLANYAYRLSKDATAAGSTHLLNSIKLPKLNVNQIHDASISRIAPYNAAGGDYYVLLVADHQGYFPESNEDNNIVAVGPIHINNDIDIRLNSVTPINLSPRVGDQVEFDISVTNLGPMATPSVLARIHLSPDGVNNSKLVSSTAISALAAGETRVTRFTFNTDISMIGNHYLIASLDYYNNISETNEDNNILASNQLQILESNVDLVMTQLATDKSSGESGSTVVVSSTVSNINSGTVAPGLHVGLYMAEDSGLQTGLRQVGSWTTTQSLSSGQSESSNVTITLPDVVAGTYYFGAIADRTNLLIESNEDNNSLSGPAFSLTTPSGTGYDMEMLSANWPTHLSIDGTMYVDYVVRNAGTYTLGSRWWGPQFWFYLSTDASFDWYDTILAQGVVRALTAGNSLSGTMALTIPADTPPGDYYLAAFADPIFQVNESNEDNNVIFTPIKVVYDYDLKALSTISASTAASPGSDVIVTSTISNSGVSPIAAGHNTGLYLSNDATIDSNDRLLASWPSFQTLANGGNESRDLLVTLPANLANGTYYIGAIADYDNTVSEQNETNNSVSNPHSIVVSGGFNEFDLVASTVSTVNSSVLPGDTIVVDSSVLNTGMSDIAAGHSMALYLSTDRQIDGSDLYLNSWLSSLDLAKNQSESNSINVNIPSGIAVGTYYLGAIADANNTIAESNESNNAIASVQPIAITGNVDLSVSNINSPAASISAGASITVSAEVSNSGGDAVATSLQVGIFLSLDETVSDKDVLIGTWSPLADLAGGTTTSFNANLVLPETLAAGEYYVGVLADYANLISESNENNNSVITLTRTVVNTCTVNSVEVDCVTGIEVPNDRALLCPERVYEPIYGRYCDYRIPEVRFSAYRLQHAYDGGGFNQGTTFNQAFQLNDNGDVVGSAITSNGEVHAARINVGDGNFENLYITDLGVAGFNSVARSVSNEMTYAGSAEANMGDGLQRDAIWHSALGNHLTLDSIGNTQGIGVDTARTQAYQEFIAGYGIWNNDPINSDGLEHGFVWAYDGNVQTVTVIGNSGEQNRASAINDSETVVGYTFTGSDNRAYVATAGTISLLNDSGANNSQALAINNNVSAKIVGYSTENAGTRKAVMWQNNTMYVLPALSASTENTAKAISDGGDIVGQSNTRAVFWRNGIAVDLNNVVDNSTGVTFTEALDINRRGRVLVKGDDAAYYVLIPSSE